MPRPIPRACRTSTVSHDSCGLPKCRPATRLLRIPPTVWPVPACSITSAVISATFLPLPQRHQVHPWMPELLSCRIHWAIRSSIPIATSSHNIGTGDGIVQNGGQETAQRMRAPPLWGVRTRTELLHDGRSNTFFDTIQRHRGAAQPVTNNFNSLSTTQQNQLITFLRSL